MKLSHLSLACTLATSFAACSAASNTNQTAAVVNTPPSSSVNSNAAPIASPVPAEAPVNTNQAANANVALASAEDFTASRALYAKQCAACHGAGGEGQNMGSMNIPSLKSAATMSDTDAELNNYITNGALDKGMPAFKGKLTKAQIETMVRYIRTEIQDKGAKGAAAPKTANQSGE